MLSYKGIAGITLLSLKRSRPIPTPIGMKQAPIVVLNPHVGSDRTTMVKPLIVGLIPNVALGLNNNSRL